MARAREGAYIIPLYSTDASGVCVCHTGVRCDSAGKHPRTRNGLNDASCDEGAIRRWWDQWPDSNVGERTEAVARIDIDLADVAEELANDAPLRAETELVRTPRRSGLHIALRVPKPVRGRDLYLVDGRKLGELKASGGYVLVPPSTIAGKHYETISARGVAPMEVEDPIEWLRRLLPSFGLELATDAEKPRRAYEDLKGEIYEGEGRHNALNSYAGKVWIEGMSPSALVAVLRGINNEQCRPPLPDEELFAIAKHFIERRKQRSRVVGFDGRKQIVITHRYLREMAEDGWDGLDEDTATPQLFRHGDALAEIGRGDDGRARIVHLGVARLRGRLDRCADWLRRDDVGHLLPARPPKDVVEDMLALPRDLPVIRGIIGSPAFAADGTLDLTFGYQSSTGLYYEPSGEPVPPVPENPDATDVRRAKTILSDLLCDFPFADDASKAHALAVPITGVVREMIAGPTPAIVFDAPTPGSGKTLLAGCLGLIFTGAPPAVMTPARSEEEWRKRITSILRGGAAVALFDNIKHRLTSEALAGLLTSTVWADRLLSKNEEIKLPARTIWMLTGNNIELDTDIGRRAVAVRLDAMMDRPWDRANFRHPLPEWAMRHRHELVWACLVLVRHWIASGRPDFKGKPLGSYEEWCRIVGGVLQTAGISGFLDNRERLHERMDVESAEWREFTSAWWDAYADREVRVADLFAIAQEALPSAFRGSKDDASEPTLKARLGRSIALRRDRRFGDFFIRAGGDDSHAKVNTWRLERAGDSELEAAFPADPPQGNEALSDSFAGDAGVAGDVSGVGTKTVPAAPEGGEKDRGGNQPPHYPQPPQPDSNSAPRAAGDARGMSPPSVHPPQEYRCSNCRMPMSSARVSDRCGWCAKARNQGTR